MARAVAGIRTGFVNLTGSGSRIEIEAERATAAFFSGRAEIREGVVEKIVHKHGREAHKESLRVTQEIVRADVRARSYDTGEFYRSIRAVDETRGDVFVGSVSSDTVQARALERGTGIYGPARRVIRPQPPHQYLRFPNRYGGRKKWIFSKTVRGVRARRHFATGARLSRPVSIRLHKMAAREAAAELRVLAGVRV